ncbi:MAG TPA: type II toxin-antitoxin system VapC family toxin [Spirochaetota bacterium]|nr:type II toxin-antitoxin system VapC family toxin [Spirochaetota bacterium]HQQ23313.1 type II toxin-antitoxin system VapC family toxin [Spirochaetota bacterium]
MYLLDTNICIYTINKKPIEVLSKLKKKASKDIYISSITVAELEHGVEKSNYPERNKVALVEFLSLFQILYYTDGDALYYGKIRSGLEKRGRIIGTMDMLIASQALSHDLILVTNNTKEFERIENIKLENWTE